MTHFWTDSAGARRLPVELLCLAVPFGVGLAALGLGQDINWDLQNYHLYAPWALLQGRTGLDLLPAGAQTFFNPYLDLLYFQLALGPGPRAAAFVIGLLQGLNFILLYGIGRRLLPGGHFLPLLLALLGLLSTGFLAEIGTTLNDTLAALFPLAAMLLMLRALQDRRGPREQAPLLLAAGLVAGTGCALKLVFATNTLALCLALFFSGRPLRENFATACIFGLAVAAGLLLAGGYWFYQVWSLYGNPLFPLMNDIFQAELAAPESFRDARFLPDSLREKLLWPFLFSLDPYRAAELPYRQLSWPLLYCLLLVFFASRAAALLRRRPPAVPLRAGQRFVLAAFCITYLLWLNLFGIYRYLVPLDLLLPLVFFFTAAALARAAAPKAAALAVLAAVTLYNLGGVPDWGRAAWSNELFSVEAGAQAREYQALFLMGQPLAWLLPALGDGIPPAIQIEPNFGVNEAYRRRARQLAAEGPSAVIFDPAFYDRESTDARLEDFGFRLQATACRPLRAMLGDAVFEYHLCPANTLSREETAR